MKINFICHELSGNGGIETVMVKALNRLCKKNLITLSLTNYPIEKTWLEDLDRNIIVRYPKKTDKISKLIFFTEQFMSRDDVYVVLGANLLKLGFYIRKLMHKDYALVSWIHFSLFEQDMFNPKNILYADRHWAISNKIRNQLLSLGVSDEKISLIYNPVEKASMLSVNKSNELRLLYVGQIIFDGQKNLRELILAVSKITKPIIIDIYGTGKDLEKCQEYAKSLKVEDRFIWHGWVREPWKELSYFPDALVLTSKYEGLPMVVLEAEARGIPCIVSRFDGYDDIIIENVNGYSYELGDIDYLVKIVENLRGNNIQSEICIKSISDFLDETYLDNLEKEVASLAKKI